MNHRRLPVLALTLLFAASAVALGVLWSRQRQQLRSLRAELESVRWAPAAEAQSPDAAEAVSGTVPLSPDERVERMRLRSGVTDLRQRQRLSGEITNRHTELLARLAAVSNRATARLPQDYKRSSEVVNRGHATPEAAVETLVWAIAHRDPVVFVASFPDAEASSLGKQLKEMGVPAFFQEVPKIPGFRVVRREESGPDEVTLHLELAPGTTLPVRLHREAAGWRVVDL